MLLLTLLACSGELLTIDVDMTAETTIDGAGLLGGLLDTLDFTGFNSFDLLDTQELANQGVEEDDIQEVYLEELTLEVLDGDELDFLNTISFYAEAPDVSRALVASQDEFSGTFVAFELEALDLHDYVVAPSMSMDTEVNASAPTDDTTLEAYARFSVRATVGGAVRQSRK